MQNIHPAMSFLQRPLALSHSSREASLCCFPPCCQSCPPCEKAQCLPHLLRTAVSTLLGFSIWLFSGCSGTGMHTWMKDMSSREPPPAHHNKRGFIHHCLKPIKEATSTGNMPMLWQTANESIAPTWQSLFKGTPLL